MEIGFRVRDALRLHNGLGAVGGQLLERLENIFADKGALLYPAVGPVRHADVDETLVVGALQNVQAVAVLDGSNFVVDGSDAVAQECLRRGNVGNLVRPSAGVLAGGQGEQQGEGDCRT